MWDLVKTIASKVGYIITDEEKVYGIQDCNQVNTIIYLYHSIVYKHFIHTVNSYKGNVDTENELRNRLYQIMLSQYVTLQNDSNAHLMYLKYWDNQLGLYKIENGVIQINL